MRVLKSTVLRVAVAVVLLCAVAIYAYPDVGGVVSFFVGSTVTPVSSLNPLPVTGSGTGGAVTVAPYNYTVLTPGQHNLVITSSTGLTAPTGATYCVVQAKVATVSYTLDGTTMPTASIGDTLTVGSTLPLSGGMIAAARFISAIGTLDSECFK